MVLLDTTFLIDLMEDHPEALEKAEELEASSETIRIPTPVLFELWEGIERSDHPVKEEEEVLKVLESYLEAPLEGAHAKISGKKSGELIKKGRMLDPIDILIGGIAIGEKEHLVTRDEDFNEIPEVEVERYG